MRALKLFPTKKRSSRSLWAFWLLFFIFFIAVGATLTVSELLLLSNRKIVYTSIRSGNIEDRRHLPLADETFIDENNPVVFFGKDDIVFGRALSITAPRPNGDVIVIQREGWDKTLVSSVLSDSRAKSLFPSASFGLIYSAKHSETMSFTDLLVLTEVFRKINEAVDPLFKMAPVPHLLRLRSGLLGVN